MKVVPIRFGRDLLQEAEVYVSQYNRYTSGSLTLSELVRTSVRGWLREKKRKQEYQRTRKKRAKRLAPDPKTGA